MLIALGTEAALKGYRVRYTLATKLVNELVEAADENMEQQSKAAAPCTRPTAGRCKAPLACSTGSAARAAPVCRPGAGLAASAPGDPGPATVQHRSPPSRCTCSGMQWRPAPPRWSGAPLHRWSGGSLLRSHSSGGHGGLKGWEATWTLPEPMLTTPVSVPDLPPGSAAETK
jgi:hypothetical protein